MLTNKIENPTGRKSTQRAAPRNPTEAAITCRPYTSSGAVFKSDGVMRNFSIQGSYIETNRKFKSGTILILQIVRYPSMPASITHDVRPRSICLAEVKWQQELFDENAIRYGIGLKYLQ